MDRHDSRFEDLLPEIPSLARQLGLNPDELNNAPGVVEALRALIISRIEDLMVHQRELLMSLLYRVDVDEALVVSAFRTLEANDIAPRLADLIIDRQVEKIRSRRAYRDRNS